MNWDTVQQLIRIVMYASGSALLGDGVADGAEYQAAIGGAVSIAAFLWWWFWERARPPATSHRSTLRSPSWAGMAAVALLMLTACADTPYDVRNEWLVACTSYTSVVEQIETNIALGIYTPEQVEAIHGIEDRTSPLCLNPVDYQTNTLILSALRELNTYLLMRQMGDMA